MRVCRTNYDPRPLARTSHLPPYLEELLGLLGPELRPDLSTLSVSFDPFRTFADALLYEKPAPVKTQCREIALEAPRAIFSTRGLWIQGKGVSVLDYPNLGRSVLGWIEAGFLYLVH